MQYSNICSMQFIPIKVLMLTIDQPKTKENCTDRRGCHCPSNTISRTGANSI
uniref:Uncharacterized protein n=1 Tax=Rhizophora mucronata TaxID=61149 RepID=A0A2P2M7A2_RHIMU